MGTGATSVNDDSWLDVVLRVALDSVLRQLRDTLAVVEKPEATIRGMRWTAAEVGAHVVSNQQLLIDLVNGRPTGYGPEYAPDVHVDDLRVDAFAERDPQRQAELLTRAIDELEQASHDLPDGHEIPNAPGWTMGYARATWLVDAHVHGIQLAALNGTAWPIDHTALRRALIVIMSGIFVPEASRGVDAVFALHLGGVTSLVFQVCDQTITYDPSARADCHMRVRRTEDFLLSATGIRPRWRSYITGIRLSGRRPWMVRHMPRMCPAVPHGGLR